MNQSNPFGINNKYFWGIMFLFTLVYLKGLFNLIYGIDANIYASISRGIMENGNWLELYHKGNDYLDKPPLHFWLTAFSYKIFGVNSFAYKLPSFLFTILGTYSTFKLGKLLYSHNVGKLAALLFYSCFAIIMINQDVRTDTILVGIVIFSVWQLMSYVRTNSIISFIGGFVGIGLAMLAKGPIGIMVPVLALGTEFIIKRQWSNIFKWQWIVGLVIVFIVISPMLYGLYTQFDLQPDKEFTLSSGLLVKGMSGLKFYFWDQSFGRITGDNIEWKNDSTPFFFTHTYLWSFLPWSFIGLFALVSKIKQSIKNIASNEFVTLGAIILPFIAFSMSSYKLPHYIYVFFPFWIIITANYLVKFSEHKSIWKNTNYYIQASLMIIVLAVSFLVITYIFPTSNLLLWAAVLLFSFLLIYILIRQTKLDVIIYGSAMSILLVTFIFNFHFIPSISIYDAPSQAAEFSKTLKINNIYTNSEHALAFDVYSDNIIQYDNLYSSEKIDTVGNNYFFVNEEHYTSLINHYNFKTVYTFKHKGLTSLTFPFLNPKTREDHLRTFYLVEL